MAATFHSKDETIPITHHSTCNFKNLTYMFPRKHCHEERLGETERLQRSFQRIPQTSYKPTKYVSFTSCLSYLSILYGFITNSKNDQTPSGIDRWLNWWKTPPVSLSGFDSRSSLNFLRLSFVTAQVALITAMDLKIVTYIFSILLFFLFLLHHFQISSYRRKVPLVNLKFMQCPRWLTF